MKHYTYYDKITGRIMKSGTCQDDLVLKQGFDADTMGFIEKLTDTKTQYIDITTNEVKAREVNPAIINTLIATIITGDEISLTNVPSVSRVKVQGQGVKTLYDVSGGIIDIDFIYPGIYLINVESFPFLAKKFTVDIQL